MLKKHQEPAIPEEHEPPEPEFWDKTPPPDHEDFLAIQALTLRAMKANLEKRRRRRAEASGTSRNPLGEQ